MDLRDYIRTLRRRWVTVALCLLLSVAVATVLTQLSQKRYSSSAAVFVSTRNDGGAGIQGSLFAQTMVHSYARVAESRTVTDRVARTLGLPTGAVAGKVSAESPEDTVLIQLTVVDTSARRAQEITAAAADELRRIIPELETPSGANGSAFEVTITQPANLPSTPTSPRPVLALAVAIVLGLLLGFSAAVARELLDTRVKTKEDLQQLTGATPLGLIRNDKSMIQRPLVVHVASQSPRAEAFRQLRTNLQFVDVDSALTAFVVTSALPAEGKSVTACNLAITLAEAGVRTVLVEADLRWPRISEYLGIEGSVGLTSILTGEATAAEAVQHWGRHGLLVLPSGPLPPNPSELLASQQMIDLVVQLRAKSDIVIFDAPPLLPVTDAAVVARLTDGALVVVRAQSTRKEQVQRCLELLGGVDTRLLGTVLNRAADKGPDFTRSDRFHYGYYTITGGPGALAPGGRTSPRTLSPHDG